MVNVDVGETVFNPSVASSVLLQPNADICLVQRVHVPTNVVAGAQHIGTLQASYLGFSQSSADDFRADC